MGYGETGNRQGKSKKRWDVELYDGKHSFVWKYGAELIDLLAPKGGERILDIGCGTGHLTQGIASSGARVTGIDSDAAMVAQARKNYPELEFEVGDGMNFHCAEPFDAVFSNAALHWMKEPERVVACIVRALKPGGRFVAELGGRGNVEAIVEAICEALEACGYSLNRELNPWYFPTIGEYATLLERHGFRVTYAVHFDRLTPLEGGEEGMRHWVEMFGSDFLIGISDGRRADVIRRVEDQIRPRLYRDGTWFADYRRMRFVAAMESSDRGR